MRSPSMGRQMKQTAPKNGAAGRGETPMKFDDRKALLVLLLFPVLAAAQASVPGKVSGRATPSPTPAPTPAAPQLPIKAAPALTGPTYSPTQMDFGTIDFKASSRKTLLLTAPSTGEITVQITRGTFSAVELRRVPPPAQGKNQPLRTPPTIPVPSSGGSGSIFLIYTWNFVAGEQMQLDILFNPQAVQDSTPGPRSGSMGLTGPGLQPWLVAIPLRGAVAGLPAQVLQPV